MHFLSTGRNERIQRWISEQWAQRNGDNDTDKTPKNQDEEENRLRMEHDARADMSWDIEELEREMALTAYAHGKDNWRISVQSVDLTKLDLPTLKRLSQLTAYSKLTMSTEDEEVVEDVTSSPRNKRREARIVSNPPEIPPTPNSLLDLPEPQILRSAPVPPPIAISAHNSGVPPIAFILQETASPQPDTVHFTPTPLDLDAFPSTPRSFNSFFQRISQDKSNIQELFFSPRLQQDSTKPETPATASPQPDKDVPPGTPYSYSDVSDLSTPSLSAFPATPASSYPGKGGIAPWKSDDSIPPVPDLPPLHLNGSGPLTLQASRDKDLPPAPATSVRSGPDSEVTVPTRKRSTELPSHVQPDAVANLSPDGQGQKEDDTTSEAGTDISIGEMSSKYSVFSSRFSISSLGSNLDERRNKWSQFPFRSRAGSIGGSGRKDNVHSRARSNSSAVQSTSHSRNVSASVSLHSRPGQTPRSASSLGMHSRAPSSMGMHSRAASSLGMHSRSVSRAGATTPLLSRSDSQTKHVGGLLSRTNSQTRSGTPILSRTGSLSRKGSVPTVTEEQASISMTEGEVSFLSMNEDDEAPVNNKAKGKMRGFMSRISLKKSKSAGTLPLRPRPPRATPPLPLSTGGIVRAISHGPIGSSASSPDPSPNGTRPGFSPRDLNSDGLTRGVPLPPLSMPSVSPSNIPLPPTPLVGPARSIFGNSSPSPMMTPKTPTSGMSVTSFFGGSSSATRENAEFLLVKGVEKDKRQEELIRRWCETWGTVKQVVRLKDSGDVVIQFKNKDIVKQIVPQEVKIPEIGTVSVCWTR